MAKVTGKVLYDGAPLPTGTVIFIPNVAGPTAAGEINGDGEFQMSTHRPGDGVVVGSYRIMISAIKEGGPESGAEPLIPDRYGSEQSSGLTAEVVEGKDNTIVLELTSKPVRR